MFPKYEIKDANGVVHYTANNSESALAFYYALRNETGYAEAWHNGVCFFKTK